MLMQFYSTNLLTVRVADWETVLNHLPLYISQCVPIKGDLLLARHHMQGH